MKSHVHACVIGVCRILASGGAALSTLAVPAQTVPPPPASTGGGFAPIGLVSGQVARLNVAAVGAACNATVYFTNAAGTNLYPPDPTGSTVSLAAGQSTFIDQAYPPDPIGGRQELTPRLVAQLDAAGTSGCAGSVEVYDRATGYTRFAAPWAGGCNGAGAFVAGAAQSCALSPLGVGAYQTARVNATAFYVPPGAVVAVSDTVGSRSGTLSINASNDSARFDVSRLVSRIGQRAEVAPLLTVTPPCAATGCASVAGDQAYLVYSEEIIGPLGARSNVVSQPYLVRLFPPTPAGGIPSDPLFGAIGVARGQGLRLNVAATQEACSANLQLRDAAGNVLASEPGLNIEAGQSVSLTFLPTTYPPDPTGSRIEVLPQVNYPPDPAGGIPAGCIATAEVFDRSLGVTSALVRGVAPGSQLFPPDPTGGFGMMGVGSLQTMRVNVLGASTDPASPCEADLSFVDSNGAELAAPTREMLNFGQIGSADLNGTGLITARGQQVEVRPVVSVVGGQCAASAETFEQITGSTLVYQGGQ